MAVLGGILLIGLGIAFMAFAPVWITLGIIILLVWAAVANN
jgi:hypothetical protein